MISLIKLLHEVLIDEGGNVFKNTEYVSTKILLANIEPTVKKFVEDLGKIFPNKKSTFTSLTDKNNWLGSTGGKSQSGDVDIAYSSEYFFKDKQADVDGWGIDQNEYTQLYEKNKKAAHSSSDEQIQLKSLIQLIVKKVNSTGGDLFTSDKASGAGSIHFSFPQYTPTGEKLDIRAQLDLDIGDMDWLKFRFNSELPNIEDLNEKEKVEKAADDYYKKDGIKDLNKLIEKYKIDNIDNLKKGLIKGLHRGQLMLAMFAATGYTFKSGKGFVRKDTGEIIADKPQSAMKVFNDEYKPQSPLTLEIINNYDKLMSYIKTNLKPEDKTKALDLFKEALRRANAYVPDNI